MEIYTIIRYEFGATKLIYSGVEKELAYTILKTDALNYLHVWEDNQEIRYEGVGIEPQKYEQYMLQQSTLNTLINQIHYTLPSIENLDSENEIDHVWLEFEELEKKLTFELSINKRNDNELFLFFGCEETDEKSLLTIFEQIKEILSELVQKKYRIQAIKIERTPLPTNPY